MSPCFSGNFSCKYFEEYLWASALMVGYTNLHNFLSVQKAIMILVWFDK